MKKISVLILTFCMILSACVLTACGDKGSSDNGGASKEDSSTPASKEDSSTPASKEDSSTPASKEDSSAPASKEDSSASASDKEGKKEESVYQTVAAALEKTMNAKSYDANIDTLLKTNLMGRLSENSMDVNVKAAGIGTDKPVALVDGQATQEGYTADHDFYYDGEWKYFSMGPEGYKSRCSFEEFAKEAGAPQNILTVLPEALFDKAESKKNDDGSVTVTLTADEAAFESMYKDAVVAVVYDVVGEDLNQTVTKDASITVTVADGYVRNFSVSFVTEITAGNDKVTYESTQSVEFINCDKDVSITPPANLENFYELDWG